MLVIDASATAPMILPDESDRLLQVVQDSFEGAQVIVPQHWGLEVLNLGLMAVRRGRIDPVALFEGLDALSSYDVRVDEETTKRSWNQTRHLASKHDLTAYDAAYLELATRTGLCLISFDKDLRQAALAEGIKLIL